MNQIHILLLGSGLLVAPSIYAQNQQQPIRPLTPYDKQQILQNIANTGDWDRINQLEMLGSNFPSMAPDCQRQINAIIEQNRYTLNGMAVIQEENAWQKFLQNMEYRQRFGHDPQPTQQSIAEGQERQRQGKAPLLSPGEKMMKQVNESLLEDQKISADMQ